MVVSNAATRAGGGILSSAIKWGVLLTETRRVFARNSQDPETLKTGARSLRSYLESMRGSESPA